MRPTTITATATVLGTTAAAPAELPRTGAGTMLLAAAGAALTGVGEVLRRLGKR